MRILVAEDDNISATLAEKLFARYGETTRVSNGEEAVVAFQAALENGTPFDLILMDIMMPEVSGQEALAMIREIETENGITLSKGVKVIMCTALSDGTNIYEAHSQGCADYLNKPLSRSLIERSLNKLGLIPPTNQSI